MPSYRIRLHPQGAIPEDKEIGVHLTPLVEPGGPPGAPPLDCTHGFCGGLTTPDGTVIDNNPLVTTVLHIIPWTDPPVVLPTCFTDEDVSWNLSQFEGPTRTPTINYIGTNWRDGISIVFDPTVDGGGYAGTKFSVFITVPWPVGGPGAVAFLCGNILLTSDPIPDILCVGMECFDGDMTPIACEGDAVCSPGTYYAYCGTESGGLPIRFTFQAVGFPSGSVTWEYADAPASPVYNYTATEGPDYLILDLTGGPGPDLIVVRFRAVDSIDTAVTAPPSPPDADGWFLVTQEFGATE